MTEVSSTLKCLDLCCQYPFWPLRFTQAGIYLNTFKQRHGSSNPAPVGLKEFPGKIPLHKCDELNIKPLTDPGWRQLQLWMLAACWNAWICPGQAQSAAVRGTCIGIQTGLVPRVVSQSCWHWEQLRWGRCLLPLLCPPGSYRLSSLYHWKSAEGTAEASHSRMPFCPTGTPVLFASEMYGGSVGRGETRGQCPAALGIPIPSPSSSRSPFSPCMWEGAKIISEPLLSSCHSGAAVQRFSGSWGFSSKNKSPPTPGCHMSRYWSDQRRV